MRSLPSAAMYSAMKRVCAAREAESKLAQRAQDLMAQGKVAATDAVAKGKTVAAQASQTAKREIKRASDATSEYVTKQPVKSVLIAAAAGAAIATLIGLVARTKSVERD